MRTKMINFPKGVKVFSVSTTIRPVTVVAEAEVKKASIKLMLSFVDMGRYRRMVPKRIISR